MGKKILFCLLPLFFVAEITCSEITKVTQVADQVKTKILSPSFSARETLKIKLDNGLEAYLIYDPAADLSAAALTVNAGSWQDPKETPGLAHFLEHMLFLGTKKYPKESSYNSFVKEHGGNTNAFTGATQTTFGFDVSSDAFPEALERFSEFFKEPLFLESGVSRELNAVNQEFLRDTENDDMREFFVLKELYNPEHPDHRFNIGNISTLKSVKTKELREWFLTHYSANLMKLVVYSSLPLEQLKAIVIKDFDGIKNNGIKPPKFTGPIKNPENQGKIAYITPVKDLRRITFSWEMPTKFATMLEEKPEELICFVLGDEGKNSLIATLKKEELSSSISCDHYTRGKDYETFLLQLELTQKGLDNIDTVILRTFQAINYLQQHGIPRYIFEDDHAIDLIKYQYPSRDAPFDTVMTHVQQMTLEDLSSYPEKVLIIQKYDPVAIKEFLSYLTPQNAFIDVVAKPELTHVAADRKEPWMNVAYALKTIPEASLKEWENAKPNPDISIQGPNPYIPKNIKLVIDKAENNPPPVVAEHKVLVDNSRGKLYFFADDRYLIPQVSAIFGLRSPAIDAGDPKQVVLADLYVRSLKEALNVTINMAITAGFEVNIERKDEILKISVNGYSDTAAILLKTMGKELKTSMPSIDKFQLYKNLQYEEYRNSAFSSTFDTVVDIFKKVIYKDYVTYEEKVKAIQSITYEDLQQFYTQLFQENYTEAVILGNMTEGNAKELWDVVLESLDSKSYPRQNWRVVKVGNLPKEEGPYYLEMEVKTQGNVALLALEYDSYSAKMRGAQQILSQSIQEPFFTELRTRQQTGYLVFSTNEDLERRLFLLFLSESYFYDPRDLLARFELFLENYLNNLIHDPTAKESFEVVRASLLTTLTQSQRSMKDMGDLLFNLAIKFDADFTWIDKRITALKALTFEEYLASVEQLLGKTHKRRLALLLEGVIPNKDAFQYSQAKSLPWLRDKIQYMGRKEYLDSHK